MAFVNAPMFGEIKVTALLWHPYDNFVSIGDKAKGDNLGSRFVAGIRYRVARELSGLPARSVRRDG